MKLPVALLCLAAALVAPWFDLRFLAADPLFLLVVYLTVRSDEYAAERSRVRHEHFAEMDEEIEIRRRLLSPDVS